MNKRKTVLCGFAVFAGMVAVYIFVSARNPASPSPSNSSAKQADSATAAFDENAPLNANARSADAQSSQDAPSKSLAGTAAELILCLVLVGALIVGLMIFLKKILPGSHRIFDTQAIEVLGKSHLSSKQAIYLARIGPRVLVLGVAEHSISVLSEISDPEEINELKAKSAQGKSESVTGAFMSIFKRKGTEFSAEPGKSDQEVRQGIEKIQSLVDKWHKGYSTQ